MQSIYDHFTRSVGHCSCAVDESIIAAKDGYFRPLGNKLLCDRQPTHSIDVQHRNVRKGLLKLYVQIEFSVRERVAPDCDLDVDFGSVLNQSPAYYNSSDNELQRIVLLRCIACILLSCRLVCDAWSLWVNASSSLPAHNWIGTLFLNYHKRS